MIQYVQSKLAYRTVLFPNILVIRINKILFVINEWNFNKMSAAISLSQYCGEDSLSRYHHENIPI